MATTPEDTSSEQPSEKTNTFIAPIIFAICIFIFVLLVLFIYGFQSQFYEDSLSDAQENMPMLFMSSMFTILGFGLLLSPYARQKMTGLAVALFAIAFCYIVGPLLQQLWFTAFFSQFFNKQGISVENFQELWDKGTQENVRPSFSTFRLANLCCVSFLISLSGMSGRMSIGSVFQTLLIFNIFWYMNLNLNLEMSFNNDPKSLTYLDDYGTYLVYLFGAVHGLMVCLFNRKGIEGRARNSPDHISIVYYLLGSAFLFCTFLFMGTHVTQMTNEEANFKANAGAANILFTMTGSILGTYIGSLFVNGGKVGVWEAAFGTVVGGTVIGAGAGFIESIGICILLGILAGFLTAIIMSTVWVKVNESGVLDSQGFILPVLLTTFLGGFIAFPCIIIRHYTLQGDFVVTGILDGEDDWMAAGFQLAYFGVTLGIALGTGIISALLTRFAYNEHFDFADLKIFSYDYGLYDFSTDYEQSAPIESESGKGLQVDQIS